LTHGQINPSAIQHIDTSTHRPISKSGHQDISQSAHQHIGTFSFIFKKKLLDGQLFEKYDLHSRFVKN
jgi:hypothetical protein